MNASQLIALLPREVNGESVAGTHIDDYLRHGGTALVRDAEGQMSLESIEPDSAFIDQIMSTGCFRRGKPIFDPVSRQVMGYEMEMIATAGALRARCA